MVSCVVCHLAETPKTRKIGISFHRFPQKKERKLMWIGQMNLENTQIKDSHRLCSQHFTENSFNRTYAVVRLKDDAIPTFVIDRITSVQMLIPKQESSYCVHLTTSQCSNVPDHNSPENVTSFVATSDPLTTVPKPQRDFITPQDKPTLRMLTLQEKSS